MPIQGNDYWYRITSIASVIGAVIVLEGVPALASEKTIVVYASADQQSDVVVSLAKDIAGRISRLQGFKGELGNASQGSSMGLGRAAFHLGANEYLIVQTTNDRGTEIATVSGFSSSSDRPFGEANRISLSDWKLPNDFDVSALLPSTGLLMPRDSKSVLLPGGTEVTISTLNTLSSASAVVGDRFAFSADKNVVINDSVVIRKGAHGQGTITSVEGAGSNGHEGKLSLQFDYITGQDGLKILLTDSNNAQGGEEKKGASSTATILGYALLGPVGLFAHNFVRGRQMEITPSMQLIVYTDHNVHIIASDSTNTDAGYAK
jgi:hypothetical protein